MGRAPCCEKMGLKKGPWTNEEDQVLISYIQQHGHANWRALPKQAGLLRCGKSCRLRWINYLRPDIKRGNFTKEEESSIFQLHEMLGNKWSAIAANLPGRTDNEIKNVWHTHLKKKLKNSQPSLVVTKPHSIEPNCPTRLQPKTHGFYTGSEVCGSGYGSVSPERSSSELSSVTDLSVAIGIKHEQMESSESTVAVIDESFWAEELVADDLKMEHSDFWVINEELEYKMLNNNNNNNNNNDKVDDGMNFWYNLFIRAGEIPELPEF